MLELETRNKINMKEQKEADKWFSKFIRLRDCDTNGLVKCCTCGAVAEPKQMQNGHYIKRRHNATRYSEVNCNTQCKHCNEHLDGNDEEYKKFLIDKYGLEVIEALERAKNTYVKYTKSDYIEISKFYKSKAQELAKLKGIELW